MRGRLRICCMAPALNYVDDEKFVQNTCSCSPSVPFNGFGSPDPKPGANGRLHSSGRCGTVQPGREPEGCTHIQIPDGQLSGLRPGPLLSGPHLPSGQGDRPGRERIAQSLCSRPVQFLVPSEAGYSLYPHRTDGQGHRYVCQAACGLPEKERHLL